MRLHKNSFEKPDPYFKLPKNYLKNPARVPKFEIYEFYFLNHYSGIYRKLLVTLYLNSIKRDQQSHYT